MSPVKGMIRYNTDNIRLERSTDGGTTWVELDLRGNSLVAHPYQYSVRHLVDVWWNLTDADDVISIYCPSFDVVVTLHEATTAKVKPYYIKCWGGNRILVRPTAGNFIDAGASTQLVIAPDASVTLIPLTGHPYWAII